MRNCHRVELGGGFFTGDAGSGAAWRGRTIRRGFHEPEEPCERWTSAKHRRELRSTCTC